MLCHALHIWVSLTTLVRITVVMLHHLQSNVGALRSFAGVSGVSYPHDVAAMDYSAWACIFALLIKPL